MASFFFLKSMLYASVLQKSKKKRKVRTKKTLSLKHIDLKMCRICNNEKGEIPIFENLTHPNIPEEIKNFSGISINLEDDLPKCMCQNCLHLLNGCILFRDMCQSSNKFLIELTIKRETEAEKQKEINNEKESIIKPNCQENNESYYIPSPTFSDDNSDIWNCSICNKEFFDMDSYNMHLTDCNTPTIDVPKPCKGKNKMNFLCDICGKTARSNAHLLIHMGIHENIFPFKCEECPYQGRTMDLLKVHKRTHLADKPFKCTQCPKSTTTASNLMKHMRHVHSTNRPFKCTYCDKAFSYQHDMKRHIRDIHLRQGTVECEVCLKNFNTKKILQGHRWKIHKIKGERHGRLPSYLQCQQDEA